MKRVLAWAACTLLAAGCKAEGIGRIADVLVIDRESGASLPVNFYRGEYWVAGRPGSRYAIEIRNRSAGRTMAVTSVDGVNVLSGETAAWDQSGYVFAPGERYQISGWRKTDAQVAAFVFSASANSYAERTGRPANVGVIGIALFRERPQQPAYAPQESEARRAQSAADAQKAESGAGQLNRIAPPPAAQLSAPKLGTAHGEREYSYVTQTEFARLQSEPNEIIRIHYDSMENLVAMGVIRRPHWLPNNPNPFPGSADSSYVPDPPG
jgi:hypothetical protein